MSAIFGMIHLDKRPAAPDDLARMAAALSMYGRAGGGQWQHAHVGLGQCLHQVTPHDRFEQQPRACPAGQVCLVMDGRIDNRPELLDALKIERAAAELPDSALILAAYARWGRECVHHLIGAFTFALWDTPQQQLLLVRSAVAGPSLFFHVTPHTLAFATMPKGLFALPTIPRALDEPYLADYLARTGTEPTATLYHAVQRLLPGQMLVVQADRWTVTTFWQPDLTRTLDFRRDEEYVEAFNALFARVVQDHLRSHTPAGVMMSGGLDSTSVAAIAAQHYQSSGQRLATFTEVPRVGFDGAIIGGRYADETPYVQTMARRYPNLDLNLIHTDGQLYLDDLDTFFAASEFPFPNATNRVWIEAILRAAQAGGVGVLLTGMGGNLTISWRGDGLLAHLVGRGQWVTAWREASALAQHGYARSPLHTLVRGGILPHLPEWGYAAVERLRTLGRSNPGTLAEWRKTTPIHPEFAAAHQVEARAEKRLLRDRLAPATRVVRMNGLLADARRADGLIAGYQARYGVTITDPSNDLRLVEFCLAVPEAQFLRNGTPRWLIRRAMADHLPPENLANRQRGLQAADWYERLYHARGRIHAELARIEQSDLARRALDLPRLRSLAERMETGTASAERQMLDYRRVLERGLMAGSFIRWVEGGQ